MVSVEQIMYGGVFFRAFLVKITVCSRVKPKGGHSSSNSSLLFIIVIIMFLILNEETCVYKCNYLLTAVT